MDTYNISFDTPLIIVGPPGSGKSYWIQEFSKKTGRQLLVCPCRKDRTLRDGRQKLHVWAKRTELVILWLEGADDLTPEAQAFLRRILETHAPQVFFILECRDSGKLQEPIRSRCQIKSMSIPSWSSLETHLYNLYSQNGKNPDENEILQVKQYMHNSEYSYRRIMQCYYLLSEYPHLWKQVYDTRMNEYTVNNDMNNKTHELIHYMKKAYNPEILVEPLLNRELIFRDYGACIEQNGSSWAFLGYALFDSTTNKD
jgi:hypothetical protein